MSFSSLNVAWCGIPSSAPTPNSSHHRRRRTFRSDPYDILHVDPTGCTQKEIQRQYRKLCLKLHPDKKKNRINIHDEGDVNDEDEEHDFEFKEVQHAYSLIGTEEDRINYDLLKKYNSLSSTTSSHDASFRYPTTTNMNGWEMRQENIRFGGPSTIYFTFGDGLSFRFTNGRHSVPNFYPHRHHRQGMHHPYDSGEIRPESNQRPHYMQRIDIPLDVLYNGRRDVILTLKTSIIDRYRAAYYGGILFPILSQSSLTVFATWFRSQKINWLLSIVLFVSIIHVNIPAPPTKVTYKTTIKKGWKGGTKIKYTDGAADITFILQEVNHTAYTRVGNDLHSQVTVSSRQLRKGCTLTLPPMCESDPPIQIKLHPNEVKDGDIVTINSRGWPIGGGQKDEYGDLHVKICRLNAESS